MSNTRLSPPSDRSLLRPSSPRPAQMSKSNSEGERHTQKADPVNKSDGENVSVRSCTGSPSNSRTVWSPHDSFLPRAKPPPPLRRIKHERNRSENTTAPPPSSTTSSSSTSSQPSTSRRGSRQSLKSTSMASPSSRSSLDASVSVILSKQNDGSVGQPALTRSHTRMTSTSEVSSTDIDISLGSSKFGSRWKWEPPTSWAGPSRTASADGGDGLKPVQRFLLNHKKSAECILQGGSTHAPASLSRSRSLRKLRPLHASDDEEPKGAVYDRWRRPPHPGVAVEIQCYENGGWNEKPVADVIPMLRELKHK